MKIKDLLKIEMPRERLEKYGVKKLADYELLALILGSGVRGANVLNLSQKILKVIATKKKDKITFDDLLKLHGLGRAKVAQVIAMIELSFRFSIDIKQEIITAKDIWKLSADFRAGKREHVIAFYLDTKHCIIERQIISIGTLSTSLVHPREVFEPAIVLHAASVIVVHNHPSGDVEPSLEDREVTDRLVESGRILGIDLADHVIVSKTGWMSFKEKTLL
ncbi:MAG: DNA repair protein RadC [Patescibacteria group bacterium]